MNAKKLFTEKDFNNALRLTLMKFKSYDMKFKYDDFVKMCVFNKLAYAPLILKSLLKNGSVKNINNNWGNFEIFSIYETYPLEYEIYKRKSEYNRNYQKKIATIKPVATIDSILAAIKLLRENGYKGKLSRTIETSITL